MRIRILLVCCLLGPSLLYGETSVWTRIEELSQHDTPQGNPQLENYLKTLTRQQMLEAARECCKKAEARVPQERWEEGVLPVSLALAFYGDEEGKLSDGALNQLLDCIASENEGLLFRETVLSLLRQKYWEQMTDVQRRQCKQRFIVVLSDQSMPARLRALSCRELSLAIAENYRSIIISDKNVRPLRDDKTKWSNLNNLIRSGEIQLDPETHNELKLLSTEIEDITPTIDALSQDAAESPEVKNRAQNALKTLADLPVAPAPVPESVP